MSHRTPLFLLIVILSNLFVLGLVTIYSTTSADVLDHDLAIGTETALLKQLAYAFIGGGLGFLIFRFGYRKFLTFSPCLLAIVSVLLVLTLIPGIGREVNGSRRWLSLGGISVQPSEFVKILVPAFFICQYQKLQGVTFVAFIKLVSLIGIPMVLILVEPNNGTVAVIGMTLAVTCFLMRVPLRYWALPLCALAFLGGVVATQHPYVAARLKVYRNPELDLLGKGHQPYQAKIAAGSGGFLGKGPGNSWQKLSYLPEAQNDYIAAIFAEEFGFAGVLLLISLYMGVAYCGIAIALFVDDLAGAAYVGTLVFLISLQAFLNLGVVSGLLPSTGLNLPFFSQGGTSLIANLIIVALIASTLFENTPKELENV